MHVLNLGITSISFLERSILISTTQSRFRQGRLTTQSVGLLIRPCTRMLFFSPLFFLLFFFFILRKCMCWYFITVSDIKSADSIDYFINTCSRVNIVGISSGPTGHDATIVQKKVSLSPKIALIPTGIGPCQGRAQQWWCILKGTGHTLVMLAFASMLILYTLKDQYRHDQARLSTGHGIGVRA